MKLVLAGGGTGGHIYPAIALAETAMQEVRKRDERAATIQITFVGGRSGLESALVAQAGYDFHPIATHPLPQRLSLKSLKAAAIGSLGFGQALRYLHGSRPDVVIGTGGYASVCLVLGATWLRVPTIVLEQNVVPGRSNRFLAAHVDLVATSFAETRQYLPQDNVRLTGNPVRRSVIEADRCSSRSALGLGERERLLLIFGGSRAARAINQAVFDNLQDLVTLPDLRIVHLCGHADLPRAERYGALLPAERQSIYRPQAYCHQMETLLAAADLAVSRAGGTTLAELTTMGLPAIVAPYRYHADRHQQKNADVLARAGAALVLDDRTLARTLSKTVAKLFSDPNHLSVMSESSLKLGNPQAAQSILRLALDLVNEKRLAQEGNRL